MFFLGLSNFTNIIIIIIIIIITIILLYERESIFKSTSALGVKI